MQYRLLFFLHTAWILAILLKKCANKAHGLVLLLSGRAKSHAPGCASRASLTWRLDTTTARIVQMLDVRPRAERMAAHQGLRGRSRCRALGAVSPLLPFGAATRAFRSIGQRAPALDRFIAFDRQARTRYDRAFLMETWPRGRRHSPAKGACGLKLASRVRIPPSPPEGLKPLIHKGAFLRAYAAPAACAGGRLFRSHPRCRGRPCRPQAPPGDPCATT